MKRSVGYLLYVLTVLLELAAAWLRWRVSFAFFSLGIYPASPEKL
jgi:hypothetical protein